ncbi:MAG: shikimate dehydrogenase [Gemmatimonadaceae bacterium]
MTIPERLALFGHPVAQSLSPAMHNAALAASGRTIRYETIDVLPENFDPALREFVATGGAGNVTIPHKLHAFQCMDACTEPANKSGAVNTFWRDDYNRTCGHNTDVAGFTSMIAELLGDTPSNMRVAVLGSGGAAGAVLTAIADWPGVTATVHGRDLARAAVSRMRHSVVVRAASMRDPLIGEADIVVNATPVGMSNDDLPVELDRVAPTAIIIDLVYGANETAWVRAARARGHRAVDGLSMLLHQGVAAFECWFGEEPDQFAMKQALAEAAGRT